MDTRTDRAIFLRRSLQLDGIASALCGALLLLAARPVSDGAPPSAGARRWRRSCSTSPGSSGARP
jgi:hypothetical protein